MENTVVPETAMPAHLKGWPLKCGGDAQQKQNCAQNWCGTKTPQQQAQAEAQNSCFVSGAELVANLVHINQKIDSAASRACRAAHRPRLVAVSKLVPAELIQVAHNAGQRAFGENYVEELILKAQQLSSDIEWHFLGHLTPESARQLVDGVPNLFVVESVDSTDVALALHQSAHKALQEGKRITTLPVYLQVNTCGDSGHAGVQPADVVSLARFVSQNCPALCLAGLMVIGGPADAEHDGGKQDFKMLKNIRRELAAATNRQEEDFKMSMGITQDFEAAISFGSNSVRIGTAIFGERPDVSGVMEKDENQKEVEMREH